MLNRLRGQPSEPSITRRQALSAYPVRNPDVTWRELESNEVVVTVKRPSKATWRIISWLFYVPESRDISLDEVGSFIWQLCDGEHSVADLVEALVKEYKLGKRESEVSLTTYLRDIGKRGLIAFLVPEEADDASTAAGPKAAKPERDKRSRARRKSK